MQIRLPPSLPTDTVRAVFVAIYNDPKQPAYTRVVQLEPRQATFSLDLPTQLLISENKVRMIGYFADRSSGTLQKVSDIIFPALQFLQWG